MDLEPDLKAGLLAELKFALNTQIEFSEPPVLLAGGYDTKIVLFRLSGVSQPFAGPLVARIFPSTQDQARAAYEAAVHSALAQAGVPVPGVHLCLQAGGDFNRPILIMDYVAGETLLALEEPDSSRLLGETHASLHSYPIAAIERSLAQQGVVNLYREDLLNKIAEAGASFPWAKEVIDWLIDGAPPENQQSLCHGDFHKLNVLQERARVTGILDWSNFALLDPAFDVANTQISFLILAKHLTAQGDFSPVDLHTVVAEYLKAYNTVRVFDDEHLPYYLVLRGLMILFLAAMKRSKPYQHPLVVRDLCQLIHLHTGLKLEVDDVLLNETQ